MDFLRAENLLQFGYKDGLLCEVERKGEEKRCIRGVGRMDQRDRLLWEINRERIRRNAARMSLAYPGAGHFYSGRDLTGGFWASLPPLTAVLVAGTWRGAAPGSVGPRARQAPLSRLLRQGVPPPVRAKMRPDRVLRPHRHHGDQAVRGRRGVRRGDPAFLSRRRREKEAEGSRGRGGSRGGFPGGHAGPPRGGPPGGARWGGN